MKAIAKKIHKRNKKQKTNFCIWKIKTRRCQEPSFEFVMFLLVVFFLSYHCFQSIQYYINFVFFAESMYDEFTFSEQKTIVNTNFRSVTLYIKGP